MIGRAGLLGDQPGDCVDGDAAQALLVAEEIVDGGDRLNAADGLAEMIGGGGVRVLANLDREQRGHGLQVVADAVVHLLEERRGGCKAVAAPRDRGWAFSIAREAESVNAWSRPSSSSVSSVSGRHP